MVYGFFIATELRYNSLEPRSSWKASWTLCIPLVSESLTWEQSDRADFAHNEPKCFAPFKAPNGLGPQCVLPHRAVYQTPSNTC